LPPEPLPPEPLPPEPLPPEPELEPPDPEPPVPPLSHWVAQAEKNNRQAGTRAEVTMRCSLIDVLPVSSNAPRDARGRAARSRLDEPIPGRGLA
jgi:hypothetical protein